MTAGAGPTSKAVLLGLVSLSVGLVLRTRPRRMIVEGSSMEPGLQPGDRLLVVRDRRPRLGEIVALTDPRERARVLVKRLVSVSGEGYGVAGDNPGASTDSRDFGPVGRDAFRGRAVYCYGPAGRSGPVT